jgi:ABC-2 type transport system permease protein
VVEALEVYRRLIGARIRSQLQYRTSFVLFSVGQFLITFVDFAALLVVFSHVRQLAGWSLWEVAFLYGLSGLAFSLADVFVSEVEYLPDHVKAGTFDHFLIRPRGALFQLCAEEFELRRAAKLLEGIVVFGVACSRVGVHWSVGRVAVTAASALSGAVIFGSVWVIGAALNFWLLDAREVMNSFTYGGNFLTQYPLPIYGALLRRVLAFVVPLAFVSFFPALYVLGKHDPFTGLGVVRFLSPLVAAAILVVARLAWKTGVRHYRSTGS